jgi:hypothetical protein
MDTAAVLFHPFLVAVVISAATFLLALAIPRPALYGLAPALLGGGLTAAWTILIMMATSEYVSGSPPDQPQVLQLLAVFGIPTFLAGAAVGFGFHSAIRFIRAKPTVMGRYLLLLIPISLSLITTYWVAYAALMWATG